jgi:hypothetical protein
VKDKDPNTEVARALDVLRFLSAQERIPLAIVGGLAAIYHGYERFTTDVDLVAGKQHLDVLARVAPRYAIKVIWTDPAGWHKLEFEGTSIDIVPEGARANPEYPFTIPGPEKLGVEIGLDYATLEGWMETKLASYRRRDQGDIGQLMKLKSEPALRRVRRKLAKVHNILVQRFDELNADGKKEKDQERQRGGWR